MSTVPSNVLRIDTLQYNPNLFKAFEKASSLKKDLNEQVKTVMQIIKILFSKHVKQVQVELISKKKRNNNNRKYL